MEKKRILAIIPARGGSKGLPGKNIYPVGPMQKPLIEFTMEAASKCELITEAFVCTEDAKIRETVLEISQRQYFMNGVSVINRPEELAQDNTTCEAVVSYCIDQLSKQGLNYDIVVLLQPTSPLRNSQHITNAIEAFIKMKATCLISVFVPHHHPAKSFELVGGNMVAMCDPEDPFKPRQELPYAVMPNGAIYITSVDYFKQTGKFYSNPGTIPFLMRSAISIDVDTIEDITAVEEYLKIKKYSESLNSPD